MSETRGNGLSLFFIPITNTQNDKNFKGSLKSRTNDNLLNYLKVQLLRVCNNQFKIIENKKKAQRKSDQEFNPAIHYQIRLFDDFNKALIKPFEVINEFDRSLYNKSNKTELNHNENKNTFLGILRSESSRYPRLDPRPAEIQDLTQN